MIQRIFFTFLFFAACVFGANIDSKIKDANKKLDSSESSYSRINKKMAATADAILKQKKELSKQKALLKELQEELSKKETTYKENKIQLKEFEKKQKALEKKQQNLEEELVFVIAQNVSLSIVLNQDAKADASSLIELEVLNSMLERSRIKAKELSEIFVENNKDMQELEKFTFGLKDAIDNIDIKRRKVLGIQEKNKKSLRKLENDKATYKVELKKLLKKQNSLKDTLAKLNLIKLDQERQAQEERERKAALAKKEIELVDDKNLPTVKKHGSSYQAIKTIKYKGPKTIAPLKDYTITKNYGTYTDPIYGIKIFNESISLKPKQPNSKVQTVFNGKIIYADKTAVLDNIVIVEHNDGLHTIYANLSHIAPNVRTGKKIKKGYTIGRVKDELIFEVTKKTSHINPIRLFR